MTEQLELVPKTPAPLTDRQARALDAIRQAGHDGLTGWDIGDAIGEHPLYCRANGVRLARALKARGLVRQRKGGLYVAVEPSNKGAKQEPPPADHAGPGPVPYNAFPEDF